MFKKLYNWFIRRQMDKVFNQQRRLMVADFAVWPENEDEYNRLDEKWFDLKDKLK